ncbi:hypothetical protein SAMN05444394_2966 [Algoriphagus halophilus]|uniref:Uncharacterized protein n=1 Tax=Algoriphagus halophilus TaxID=226505 RepID=A0A1N6G4Z8_9BACT|nr:hypothetical protein SAMN05444394_2966 [Algoriphagus halophilus]
MERFTYYICSNSKSENKNHLNYILFYIERKNKE